MRDLLKAVQAKDADAVKIIAERPIVIIISGPGRNYSEVLYEDRWGNQFKTQVTYP